MRDQGAAALDRVTRGEALTVTRDGDPIAELRPLSRRPLAAEVLVRRWRRVPAIDPARIQADIDAVLDPSL